MWRQHAKGWGHDGVAIRGWVCQSGRAGIAGNDQPAHISDWSSPMTKPIRQIRVEGKIAFVPLTQGQEAIIDAADVHLVEGVNWCAAFSSKFYVRRKAGKTTILIHRVILTAPDGMDVDHIDGNGLDNRRANIRMATTSQNMHNQCIPKNNTSGFKGVGWVQRCRKWRAYIALNGKQIHLGHYDTHEAAHAAYCEASARLHGEFGRTE